MGKLFDIITIFERVEEFESPLWMIYEIYLLHKIDETKAEGTENSGVGMVTKELSEMFEMVEVFKK